MNGLLLSMIGIQAEMDYQMGDFPFGLPNFRFNVPKGSVPSDKQKCQPKAQHEFVIKGIKIMQLIANNLMTTQRYFIRPSNARAIRP